MSQVKFIDGGWKDRIEDIDLGEGGIGSALSVPVVSLMHSNGQRYENYEITGQIEDVYLAKLIIDQDG